MPTRDVIAPPIAKDREGLFVCYLHIIEPSQLVQFLRLRSYSMCDPAMVV